MNTWLARAETFRSLSNWKSWKTLCQTPHTRTFIHLYICQTFSQLHKHIYTRKPKKDRFSDLCVAREPNCRNFCAFRAWIPQLYLHMWGVTSQGRDLYRNIVCKHFAPNGDINKCEQTPNWIIAHTTPTPQMVHRFVVGSKKFRVTYGVSEFKLGRKCILGELFFFFVFVIA